jgi:hypothetical protein
MHATTAAAHPVLEYAPPAQVRPFDMGKPDVVLLITGANDGMLEVCNCPGPMAGGLSRRAGLVRSYRAAFGDAVVAVDSGGFFAITPKSIRNEYIARAYDYIGYDAVALGEREWSDVQGLAAVLAGKRTAWLSTTVAPATGPALAKRVVLRRPGEARLAIVSCLRPEDMTFASPAQLDALEFSHTRLGGEIDDLKSQGQVVVAVVRGDADAARVVALGTRADLVIRGAGQRTDVNVAREGGTPIVKVGGPEYVGAVALKIKDGRIADLEYRVEAVDTHWPLDPEPMRVYQAYAHHEMQLALGAPRRQGLNYVPSSECGSCHQAQYGAWSKSRHARAFATLGARAIDPNCVACHSTGFGFESGFHSLQKTPGLAGVNCQTCHRVEPGQCADGFKPPKVTENVCASCHTPVTDPRWDFQKRLKDLGCPATRPRDAGTRGLSRCLKAKDQSPINRADAVLVGA